MEKFGENLGENREDILSKGKELVESLRETIGDKEDSFESPYGKFEEKDEYYQGIKNAVGEELFDKVSDKFNELLDLFNKSKISEEELDKINWEDVSYLNDIFNPDPSVFDKESWSN